MNAMPQPPKMAALANVENEQLLLSALMTRPTAIEAVCDRIVAANFYEPAHEAIFAVMMQETALGRPITPVALAPLLGAHPALQPLDGAAYLASLSGYAGALVDIRWATQHVADMAARRQLVVDLAQAQMDVGDLQVSLPELVDRADAAFVSALEQRRAVQHTTLNEAIGGALKRIEDIQANEGKVGATTGIAELDELLGGFEPGQMDVVAARPGMGKTAVACSTALGLARQGHGVAFFSMEMTEVELGLRMVSDLCCRGHRDWIPYENIVQATVTRPQLGRMVAAQDAISRWPLVIIDKGSMTISSLTVNIRRAKRRMEAQGHKLRVVIIDYLQLVHADQKGANAYETVSQVSRGLKAVAKDLGITVVALAQLNRSVEQREDKRPMLSDLRDSGQIEQDADAVLFLYRDEYYLEREKPKKGMEDAHEQALQHSRDKLTLICAKRRNGRTGTRTCRYLTSYQAVRSADWGY